MPGPRMFVAGYGLQITRGRTPSPNTADGVDRSACAWCAQQVGGGRGRDQDVRIHRLGPRCHGLPDLHLRGDEGRGGRGPRARQAHRDPHLRSRWRARRGARRRRFAWSTRPTWTTPPSRRWCARKTFYVPTIDHNRYYADNYRKLNYPPKAVDDLNDYIAAQPGDCAQGIRRRRALRHGLGRGLHDVRREHARAGLVRQGGDDAGTGAARPPRPTARNCWAWRNRWARSGRATSRTWSAVEGDPLADIDVVIRRCGG